MANKQRIDENLTEFLLFYCTSKRHEVNIKHAIDPGKYVVYCLSCNKQLTYKQPYITQF